MNPLLHQYIHHIWYSKIGLCAILLLPFSALFYMLISLRRFYFSLRGVPNLPVPVIVVGNITVGGAGKTPAVLALLKLLKQHGLTAGIIARGDGAEQAVRLPRMVDAQSSARECGDEAVLLAQRAQVPVAVASNRYLAACHLLKQQALDVIVSDDGLQHYRLPRAIEITMIDGHYRFGNGLLLPAGPLREPVARAYQSDCVIVKGHTRQAGEYAMQWRPKAFVKLSDGQQISLDSFAGQRVSAYAGIAHPDSFFESLRGLGIIVEPRVRPDHH